MKTSSVLSVRMTGSFIRLLYGWDLYRGFVRRLVIQGVDDFAGAGVMQALTGFVFNSIRVVLQVIDMVLHATILVLQFLNLLLQLFIFYPFLLVSGDAVLSKDNVITEKDRQRNGCSRSNASAHAI